MIKKHISIILFILLATLSGCTNDFYENEETSIKKDGIPVSFSLNESQPQISRSDIKEAIDNENINTSFTSSNTKLSNRTKTVSTSPILPGTTIRVVAYRRYSANSKPNVSSDQFVSSQSFQLGKANNLIPVNVDKFGNIIGGEASEMYLTAGEYDFYAYSPALPLSSDSTVTVLQGSDFIETHLYSAIINSASNNIDLPNFSRKMAQVEFYIQPDPSVSEINSISFRNSGASLILPGEAFHVHKIGDQYFDLQNRSSYMIPEDSCKQINPTKLKFTACVFPFTNKDIAIELNLNVNGSEKFYNAYLDSATFNAGNKYIYQINLKLSNLDILPIANCYMIKPGTSIIFPVNQIAAMGGFNMKYQTWNASVYWETSSGLIRIEDEDQTNDVLKVSTSEEGNGLIVITAKNSNTILWSWHIWSTDYIPDEGLNSPVTSTVPGGRVIRLHSKPFSGNTKVMMDRNLGALETSETIKSWGMHYQWGRKDPFPPTGVQIYGNKTQYSLAYLSDYYTAIENPGTFYYGYFNWLVGGNDYLWTDTQKSIFDPCPPGWKVASASVYNVNMSNTIRWIANPGKYADGAIYTPVNIWYPAQGAISYFTGNFTQQGQYAYLWSSTDGYFDSSYALTISRNFNTSANDLDRANGLPVRCIQNEAD